MVTSIAVVSDTHCVEWREVHPEIREMVSEADIAVHCGDFTKMSVVEGDAGVRPPCGSGAWQLGSGGRQEGASAVDVFEAGGLRVGVTHPAWGGPPFGLGELLEDFTGPVDVVLFGHLHEVRDEVRDGVLFVSPGQGYRSFMVSSTAALVTVEGGSASVDIRVIEAAEERRGLRSEV